MCLFEKGQHNTVGNLPPLSPSFSAADTDHRIPQVTEKLILPRLNSSSAHPEPVYEGTRTDYGKDQAVFDEGAVPFLSVW